MRKTSIRLLFGWAIALYLAVPVSATVSVGVDLMRDGKAADFVCVGRIVPPDATSVLAAGSTQVAATFRVDRVLKGCIEPGSSIDVKYLDGHQHFYGYDLVFLSRKGQDYQFAYPECCLPVCEEAYSPYEKSDDFVANLRWEMINSLHSSSVWVIESALEQSCVLTPSDIETYVKPRIKDPVPRVQACALAACIAAAMDDQVVPALEAVERLTSAEKTTGSEVPFSLLLQLRRLQIKPAMVEVVAAKLNSKSVTVRRLVSFVLRQSKLGSAIPHLKTALDDSDSEVRYNAVFGIAILKGDLQHVPSMDKFAKDEQAYVGYWKAKLAN